MRRAALAGVALALAAVLGGCDLDLAGVGSPGGSCFGGCGGGGFVVPMPTKTDTVYYVVGLPAGVVDRASGTRVVSNGDSTYTGTVRVGETFTLYLVRGPRAGDPVPFDTARNVVWSILGPNNPNTVQLTPGPRGEAILLAREPGAVDVLVNGTWPDLWACPGGGARCFRIHQLQVKP